MGHIEVEIPVDDLTKEVFRFYFMEEKMSLLLDFYAKYTRKTKRHGWNADSWYSRLDRRGVSKASLKLEDVPLTDDVEAKVLESFISKLTVTTSKD